MGNRVAAFEGWVRGIGNERIHLRLWSVQFFLAMVYLLAGSFVSCSGGMISEGLAATAAPNEKLSDILGSVLVQQAGFSACLFL